MSANCILVQMDFFMYYQKDYSPEFTYSIFTMFVHLIFQYYFLFFGKQLGSYKFLLFLSIIVTIIKLFLIPIIVVFIPGFFGFLIMVLIMILIGITGTLLQSSVYGMVSILPSKYIVIMMAGQGFAGIILNIIKYIILFCFDSTEGKSPEEAQSIFFGEIYLFYSCASFFLIVTMFLVLVCDINKIVYMNILIYYYFNCFVYF